MATQGRPNISLLPIAGSEITRAREQQQALGLQAAMARLQAQAQEAALEERAREFDVNAQLRREATFLDQRFRQQQLSFRRQQFQQQAQQARFGQELSIERFGLQQQELRLSFERETRLAEQAEEEFGFRSEQFEEAKRRVGVAEKMLTRTESQKRFQTFLDLLKKGRGSLFTIDPNAIRGRAVIFDPKAAPLLEGMAKAFNEANPGSELSINQLQDILNPQLARQVSERQRVQGQQQIAVDLQQQRIRESESLVEQRLREPEARGRVAAATPQQQFAQKIAAAEIDTALRLELEAQTAGITDGDRSRLQKRSQELFARAENRFRAATPVPTGPSPAESLALTRREQFEQRIGRRQAAGAPSAARQAAGPTDLERLTRGDLRQFLQETEEEAQGFQTPSQAAATVSPQDNVAMQGYIDNGLRILDSEKDDINLVDLIGKVAEKKKDLFEAFAIKNQKPPMSQLDALDNQSRLLRTQSRDAQIDIKETNKRQQQALNNMSNQAAVIMLSQLENDTFETGVLAREAETELDEAVDDIEREGAQGRLDGLNRTFAHLREMRGKVKEKADQARKDAFDPDKAAVVIKAIFKGVPATNAEARTIMFDLQETFDAPLADDWGAVGFVSFAGNSNDIISKRVRGTNVIEWFRGGGLNAMYQGPRSDEIKRVLTGQGVGPGFLRLSALLGSTAPKDLKRRDIVLATKFVIPRTQARLLDAAIEELERAAELERDPDTGEQTIAGFTDVEASRKDMIETTRVRLNEEPPQNVVVRFAALFIVGREKGITVQEAWKTIVPFDYRGLLPDPSKKSDPGIGAANVANSLE